MARIYVCDRCGRQLTNGDQFDHMEAKYNIKLRVRNVMGEAEYDRYLNLCQECRKEIEATLDEMLMDCPEKVICKLERDI